MPVLGRASVLAVLLLMHTLASGVATRGAPEYQLKAVFLLNFTQFVEWPPASFEDKDSPVVVGILGTDPFGSYIDEVIQGEKVNGRPLIVQRFDKIQDVSACHVLFISRSEEPRLAEDLMQLQERSVLTVSDIDDFANRGGVIGFVTLDSKIRLRINLTSAKRADLMLSSKLLRPAEIVAADSG